MTLTAVTSLAFSQPTHFDCSHEFIYLYKFICMHVGIYMGVHMYIYMHVSGGQRSAVHHFLKIF